MRVAYTPGHASHHVCYLHEDSGTAFVGDVAACRIPPSHLVVPPTPPPDIDLEAWEDSIGIVEAWAPERLALTHFGPIESPAEHLAGVRARLREEADLARAPARGRVRGGPEPPAQGAARRRRDGRGDGRRAAAGRPDRLPVVGLDRYWRKRAEREAA